MQKKHMLLLSVLAVVLFSTPILSMESQDDTRKQILQKKFLADEYIWERNYEAAQNILEEALQIDPHCPIILFSMARLLKNERGREDEAKLYLEKAKKNYSKVSEVDQFFLDFYFMMKSKKLSRVETKQRIKQLKTLYPDDCLVYYTAALFFNRLAEYNLGIKNMEKALAIAPWMAPAHNLLGYIYTFEGDYNNAVRHLEKYADAYPSRANPHDSLGEIYYITGRYDKAIVQFKAALAIGPNFAEVNKHLIQAYISKGQYSRALDFIFPMLEKAESDKQKARVYATFGELFYLSGNLKKAEHKTRQALEKQPDDIQILSLLGLIQLKDGQLQEVQKTLHSMSETIDKIAKEKPDHNMEWHRMQYDFLQAKTNLALGNFDIALETLNRINDQMPEPHYKSEIRKELAEAYFASGQFDQALDNVKQILHLNPNSVDALLLQAKIFTALSKDKQAEEILNHCVEILKDADKTAPMLKEIKKLRQMTIAKK